MVLLIFFCVVGLSEILWIIFLLVLRLWNVMVLLIGLSVELMVLFVFGCVWCGVVRL